MRANLSFSPLGAVDVDRDYLYYLDSPDLVAVTFTLLVVRTRMPGGVGGEEPRGSPLSRSIGSTNPSDSTDSSGFSSIDSTDSSDSSI